MLVIVTRAPTIAPTLTLTTSGVQVNGFTALLAASSAGKEKAVEWLLERGASVHKKKEDGW